MNGTDVDHNAVLEEWVSVITDLYGKRFVGTPKEDFHALLALKRVSHRYGIPLPIVFALPIKKAWENGNWVNRAPTPEEVFDVIPDCHRDLLLARDQNQHGRVNIVEALIPQRGIRHQIRNDLKVMETVALHLGPGATIEELSRRGLHFVSEWWRVGEGLIWDCDDIGNPELSDYVKLNDSIHDVVTTTVRKFYEQFAG